MYICISHTNLDSNNWQLPRQRVSQVATDTEKQPPKKYDEVNTSQGKKTGFNRKIEHTILPFFPFIDHSSTANPYGDQVA